MQSGKRKSMVRSYVRTYILITCGDKGLIKKKCELNCSFVDLLNFVIDLFRDHAKTMNEKKIFDMSEA